MRRRGVLALAARLRASGFFDADYYLRLYPDVSDAREDPAVHYAGQGWRELRNPSAAFNTARYLAEHPDVAAAGINPLAHYLRWGRREGRRIAPASEAPSALPPAEGPASVPGNDARVSRLELTSPAVLFVDETFDAPDRSLRVLTMLDALRTLGYSVTFVSDSGTTDPGNTETLAGRNAHLITGREPALSHLREQGEAYTLALVAGAQVGCRYLMAIRAHAGNARVLFDARGLASQRARRAWEATGDPAHLLAADHARRHEAYCIESSDVTIVMTAEEQAHVEREWPGATSVLIPEVHSVREASSSWADRSGLLLAADPEHALDVSAIRWFVERVMPIVNAAKPDLRLAILGVDVSQRIELHASPTVEVLSSARDVEPDFAAARVFVAPSSGSAGMEVNIAKAMAFGLPVVAAGDRVRSMPVVDGEHLFLADDAETFAARVLVLHEDAALWERVRRNASRLVAERLSPEAAQEALRQLVAPGAASSPAMGAATAP